MTRARLTELSGLGFEQQKFDSFMDNFGKITDVAVNAVQKVQSVRGVTTQQSAGQFVMPQGIDSTKMLLIGGGALVVLILLARR